jgi:hypothetical protein
MLFSLIAESSLASHRVFSLLTESSRSFLNFLFAPRLILFVFLVYSSSGLSLNLLLSHRLIIFSPSFHVLFVTRLIFLSFLIWISSRVLLSLLLVPLRIFFSLFVQSSSLSSFILFSIFYESFPRWVFFSSPRLMFITLLPSFSPRFLLNNHIVTL